MDDCRKCKSYNKKTKECTTYLKGIGKITYPNPPIKCRGYLE